MERSDEIYLRKEPAFIVFSKFSNIIPILLAPRSAEGIRAVSGRGFDPGKEVRVTRLLIWSGFCGN